jgi:phosphatidylinositol glycan class O
MPERASQSLATGATWSTAAWTHLATWHWFFATGHACQFSALHFASPFVGFDDFEYFRGMMLMGANTFASHILVHTLLAPAALAVTSAAPLAHLVGSAPTADATSAYKRIWSTTRAWVRVLRGSELLCTMAFVFYARRHLMVWAIFAPKFVFDACGAVATEVAQHILAPHLHPQ